MQRVDHDGVLVDVVHGDRGEVHPLTYLRRQLPPLLPALGEHLGALGVVAHACHGRTGQHQMGLIVGAVGGQQGEPGHHPGHVLEPVPAADLEHKASVVRRGLTIEDWSASVVAANPDGSRRPIPPRN